MLDPETLRKLFLQNGAQGGVAAQPAESPVSGGASVSPANVMPAQTTPATGQGSASSDSPHLSMYQKLLLRDHSDVLGVNSGGLYDKSAQQQASRPLPLTPAFNPNARDAMMPRGLAPEPDQASGQQPGFGNFAIQPPEGLASFSHDVSVGAADSSNGRAPNLPPITGVNFPSENLSPVSPDIETSTNPGDIPAQLAPRAVPKVMVPQLPGRPGQAREDDGINSARYEYATANMGPDGKIKRNWRDVVGTAISNTAQAFANNPRGDWRGNLIGGIGGGALSAVIDPAGTRERNFNTYMLPQMEADRQHEYQTAQMEHQRRQAAIDEQSKLMGIRNTASQIEERSKPKFGATANGTYNQGTGEIEKLFPQKPAAPHMVQGTVDGKPGFYDTNDPALKGKIQPYEKAPQDSWGYEPDLGSFVNRRTGQTKSAPAGVAPKLSGGDEKALESQAEALVSRAFPPSEMQSLQKGYADQAYSSRVTPDDEKRASNYDPEASTKVRQYRAEADKEARATIDRESARWKQLFHDELRERARKGQPPPQGGPVTPEQVQAVANAKKITPDDALRFLSAFGYTLQQQRQSAPSGTQQLLNQSRQGWNR